MKANILIGIALAICIGHWGRLVAQKPALDYSGIKSVKEVENSKLIRYRVFNENGQPTFEKILDFRNYLEVTSTEYDEAGRATRIVTGYLREDGFLTANVSIQENEINTEKIFPTSRMQLGKSPGPKLSNPQCSMEGFPNSAEEWLGFAELKQLLEGPSELKSKALMQQDGLPFERKDYEFGQFSSQVWFTYDAEGHATKVMSVDSDSPQDTFISESAYNAKGQLLKETRKRKMHGRWSTLVETTYTYSNDRPTTIVEMSEGRQYSRISYEYDAKGRIIKETEVAFLSSKPKVTTFVYGEGKLPQSKTRTETDYAGATTKVVTKYVYEKW
jgi:hypothetical protein